MIRQREVTELTGASRDEIRYFERKGFVKPVQHCPKRRPIRLYSDEDVRLIRLIVKYRRERFELDAAYQKAKEDLRKPRLV